MATTLQRTFTFRDIALIVIGAVIGSGIFLVPGTVLRQVGGDPVLMLSVWLVGGILSILGALAFGELSAMRPEAGGIYVYLRDAFGSFLAFLYGWTLFFVIGSGGAATLAAAFAAYLGQLIPMPPLAAKLSAIGMIVVVTIVNVAGAKGSARLQGWTTAIKVSAIVIMSVALLAATGPTPASTFRTPPLDSWLAKLSGAGLAMIGVLWAYEGWQFVTSSAGETVNPQRNFPRGIVLGTAAVAGIYLLANIAYLAALGPAGMMESQRVASTSVNAYFGAFAGKLVAAAILISIFSATNAIVLTVTRVFWAMARDGVFFKRLAELHPTRGTPAFSIIASSVWAIILSITGTFEQLLTYVIFTGWIFYALGALAVIRLRLKEPDAPRPFRVPGYPVSIVLFVLSAAALVVNALFTTPVQALAGIGVVLAGAPAYLFWKLRARSVA